MKVSDKRVLYSGIQTEKGKESKSKAGGKRPTESKCNKIESYLSCEVICSKSNLVLI